MCWTVLEASSTNSVDPDQTAPVGAFWSGSTLLASILKLGDIVSRYMQWMSLADNIFRSFFSGALRVHLGYTDVLTLTMANIFYVLHSGLYPINFNIQLLACIYKQREQSVSWSLSTLSPNLIVSVSSMAGVNNWGMPVFVTKIGLCLGCCHIALHNLISLKLHSL